MKYRSLVQAVATLGVLATGCATVPAPQERLIASRSAIRAAEEVGAPQVPAAALHLQLAKESTEEAEKLMKKGDNHRADYALMKAAADADLAVALAKEAPARAEAQAAFDKVQTLKQKTAH